MDRRVRIDQNAPGTNGEANPAWIELATVWAGKKDETVMQEGTDGKTILATGRTTWTIRYNNAITPMMRLTDLITEIVYNIEGVSESGRKEATLLQTKRYNS